MNPAFIPKTLLLSCIFLTSSIISATVTEIHGKADFDRQLQENPMVVVKFHSPLCSACRNFAPAFNTASSSLEGVKFIAVDITNDQNKSILNKYPIQGVPTVHYIKDGRSLGNQSGAHDVPGTARQKFGI